MNYLIWNGEDSRDIRGLIICELPPITKPQMRVTETAIDGVDGSIIEELGYESYDKTLTIGLTQNADIDQISQYFSGSGEVVFSNEADKYYKASIIGRIDYARLVRFRTATVTFRVQPFKYEYLEKKATLRLNEYGGKNLFNAKKPSSASDITVSYEDSILSITSTDTTSRYAGMYNIEAEEGDVIRISSVLMDAHCLLVLQEYTSAFIQVAQKTMYYTDGVTPTILEHKKKDKNNRVRLVLYSSNITPTGEITARYKDTIATVNYADITFEEYETENTINSFLIDNIGNYTSKPIIEIKGSGEVVLAVNGNTLFRYTFPEGENTVIIDSQKQDAYLGADLKNRNMSGEFPSFVIGENIITWEGTVSSIKISSKSRWL